MYCALTCRARSTGQKPPDRSSPPPLPPLAPPARLSRNRTRRPKIIRVKPGQDACSQEILPFSFFSGRKKINSSVDEIKKKKEKGLQRPFNIPGRQRCGDKGEDAGSLVWSLVLTRGHPHPAQSGSRVEVMLSLIHTHALRMFRNPYANFFVLK